MTSKLGNIPTNVTAELLHSSFSPFGNIQDIQIPTDPQSRQFMFDSIDPLFQVAEPA
jgi:RNA recognition motif-containing protein